MTKQEQLARIKLQCDPFENAVGELPISDREIQEEVEEWDSYREFRRDQQTSREALTSDE